MGGYSPLSPPASYTSVHVHRSPIHRHPKLCTHTSNNLSQPEHKALERISKCKDILIKPADKGGCIVVQDTTTYIKEGLKHLHVSDPNTYTRLPGDPTPLLVESIRKLIDSIDELGYVDTYTHAYLNPPQNTRTQHMYFLKTRIPMALDPLLVVVLVLRSIFLLTWTVLLNLLSPTSHPAF